MQKKKVLILGIFIVMISLLGIVTIIYNKNNVIINKDTSNLVSLMIENELGDYEKSSNSKWPTVGYKFNERLSKCAYGSNLLWEEDHIKVITNKTDRCYVYFDIIKEVKDLSGNNYNGTFENGAMIKEDEEDNVGLYFDGINDYVDIVDLPDTIDVESGFTIEFDAKWLKFNSYSRIFDFGNGSWSDNIFVSNVGTSANVTLGTVYNTTEYRKSSGTITLNKKEHVKMIYIKTENGYTLNTFINDVKQNDVTFENNTIRNIKRINNYLGRSNWSSDGYFNGYIYNLKITDSNNEPILWYDFSQN